MLTCTFRPIDRWPREFTKARRGNPFRSPYSSTLEMLAYEIDKLSGRNIIVQTAMQESDIRQDGWPRANARRPPHPGVIVTFDSKHGPLSFVCDTYSDWEANLRAIALTLESLRAVDRYAATTHGEQYQGWKRIAAPQSTPAEFTSSKQAAEWLGGVAGNVCAADILESADGFKRAYREASNKLHPDKGGSTEEFQRLRKASELLEKRHGL